jgi:hypothetical protein
MTPKMTNSNINRKRCFFPKLCRGLLTFLRNVIRVSIYICFLGITQDFIRRASLLLLAIELENETALPGEGV